MRMLLSRRRGLEPRQIERVVILAADEMDHAIGSLTDRQVTPRLRAARAHSEGSTIGRFHFGTRAVIADQAARGPGLAFIEGKRGVNSRDRALLPGDISNQHVLLPRLSGGSAERDEQQR